MSIFATNAGSFSPLSIKGIRFSPASGGDADAYLIENSIRMEDNHFVYDPGPGDRIKWTWSGWIKRSEFNSGGDHGIFSTYGPTHPTTALKIGPTGQLEYLDYQGAYVSQYITSAVFNDAAGWYHFVVSVDTSFPEQWDRVRIYVNGERIPPNNFSTATHYSLSDKTDWNTESRHQLGSHDTSILGGLMADVQFVSGSALYPAVFGEYVDGIWSPKQAKQVTVNSGTNYSATGSDPHSKINSGSISDLFTGFEHNERFNVNQSSTDQYVIACSGVSIPVKATFSFYANSGASTSTCRITDSNGDVHVIPIHTSGYMWTDYPFTGTITQIEVGYLDGSGSATGFGGFKVDGVHLVDSRTDPTPASDIYSDNLNNTPKVWSDSSYWTFSGNGAAAGQGPDKAFDASYTLDYMNNAAGGQIVTWDTSTLGLSGKLRLLVSGSAYKIYVNGTKVSDIYSDANPYWIDCGVHSSINEIQFAGTTYNTTDNLGLGGIYLHAVEVNGYTLHDGTSYVDENSSYRLDTANSNQSWNDSEASSSTSAAVGYDKIWWVDTGVASAPFTRIIVDVEMDGQSGDPTANFIAFHSGGTNTGSSICNSGCSTTVVPNFVGQFDSGKGFGQISFDVASNNLTGRYIGITNGNSGLGGTYKYSNFRVYNMKAHNNSYHLKLASADVTGNDMVLATDGFQIGKDSSGRENHVHSTGHKVGNGYYGGGVTSGNWRIPDFRYPEWGLFSGRATTGWCAAPGDNTESSYQFGTAISDVTKIETRMGYDGFQEAKAYYTGGDTGWVAISGSSPTWNQIYSGSAVTFTKMGWRSNNGGGASVVDIRITLSDGTRKTLIGYDAQYNDFTKDSPTSGDTTLDTGIGGEISGNYAVLLDQYNIKNTDDVYVISQGGLKFTISNSPNTVSCANTTVFSGKYYWEVIHDSAANTDYATAAMIGINPSKDTARDKGVSYHMDGDKKVLNSGAGTAYGDTFNKYDVIGIALDADNDSVVFYKNGTSQGAIDISSLRSAPEFHGYTPGIHQVNGGGDLSGHFNFGSKRFLYPAPTGYKSLNSANIDDKVGIDANDYVGTAYYDGNGVSGRSVHLDMQTEPDFVWIKCTNVDSTDQIIADSVRSWSHSYPNGNWAEGSGRVTGNGVGKVTVGTHDTVNADNHKYVAWGLSAGGSANTFNKDGVGYATASAAGLTGSTSTITGSSVSTTNGFSIIKYTVNGSSQVIAHGLSKPPEVSLVKRLDDAGDWYWRFNTNTINGYMLLNDDATNTSSFAANATTVSSGYLGNASEDWIAYNWHSVPGLFSIGTYPGSGDDNGTYVSCGFRPAVVIVKSYDTDFQEWVMWNDSRDSRNTIVNSIYCHTNAVETTSANNRYVDFLADGFKLRKGSSGATDFSGRTYVYFAWSKEAFGSNSRAR